MSLHAAQSRSDSPALGCARAAFTVVELLIASTIALTVMGAVATLFGLYSRAATDSQAIVDMSNRMRGAANQLRRDLAGITAPLKPPLSPENGLGYFELIEGPARDGFDAAGVALSPASPILGDTDDVLLFTTRSTGRSFEGKYGSARLTSPTAEVAWFCLPSPVQPVPGLFLQTLYRRQLLVVGYVGAAPFSASLNNALAGTLPTAYAAYDIALRADPTLAGSPLVPNTLADLTVRENRFLHGPGRTALFPNVPAAARFDSSTGREGEDAVLTNVIGFDVRIFDPQAPARINGGGIVYPGEQGYAAGAPAGFAGGFIDLGNDLNPATATLLSGTGSGKSGLAKTGATGTAIYDTWSVHYETNGVDDDSILGPDQGTNGLDDSTPADNFPDDPGEAEVPPPYPAPLRAIEIRIRCYDPESKQVRQTTVRQSFAN
jgi:hypothetical protein